jgi:hypothetical protein
MNQVWKTLTPSVRVKGQDKEHSIHAWTTFSRIWLPSKKKLGQDIEVIQFNYLEKSSDVTPAVLLELFKAVSALFQTHDLALPPVVFTITGSLREDMLDFYEVLDSGLRAVIDIREERGVSLSPEQLQKQQIERNRKRLTVEQIQKSAVPRLEKPFRIFLKHVSPFLENEDSLDLMFHRFTAHFFRRLDWHLQSQVKIKWDRTARVLYLRQIYETEQKEKMGQFLTVARRSLPFPVNQVSSRRLMDLLIVNPVIRQGEDAFTLQNLISDFAGKEIPVDLGDNSELHPPRMVINRLKANFDAFSKYACLEKQAMIRMAKNTELLCRHIPFMSQCLEVLEKKSHNPIPIGFLGLKRRWETQRKFLDIHVPDAIEGTNLMLFLRDYIRNSK